MKRNFLVVSADARQREALAADLDERGYSVTRAASASEAERVVGAVSFDAILVESCSDDVSGTELRERLVARRPGARVIALSNFGRTRGTTEQLRFGDDDYVIPAAQVFEMLCASPATGLDGDPAPAVRRGRDALVQVIDVLVGLIELEDRHFGGSSHNAMRLARRTAEELGAADEMIHELVVATLLRDIGKVALDPDIVGSAGVFTEAQRELMKEHVAASQRLFEHVDFPWSVIPILRHHHERYDGKGYPEGLRGREIPFGSRVIAVVDAYLALTSDRGHRKAVDSEGALGELIEQTGRQFDPEVIEAFQRVLDRRAFGGDSSVKPSVLIVDPSQELRRLLKMRLLNDNLVVREADGPAEALKAAFEERPDLMLVDLDADPAESFALFEQIREEPSLGDVPFAFLSAGTDRVLKVRALRQGVDDYLLKNGDLEELTARIGNILVRESARRRGGRKSARKGITGDLENLPLPDIVQTLSLGMKTACVRLVSGGRQGSIWFENGALKDAVAGELVGELAFYEMVRWSDGEFVIEHGVRAEQQRLTQDPMFMLMEGLRLLDEEARDAATN